MFRLGSEAEGESECDEGGETEDEDHGRGPSRRGDGCTFSHLSEGCSSVMTGTLSLQRKWSSIVADMPDDLEFLRALNRHFECFGRETAWSWDGGTAYRGRRYCNGHVVSTDGHGADEEEDREMEMRARKVMFCIRELMRTERSYLDHLTRASQTQVSQRLLICRFLWLELTSLS